MTTFTKGPWATNGTRVESEHDHGWVNDGWVICECYGPDDEANARLIAAAPDLLEVLQVIAADSRWTSGEPLLMQVRAAIAKASPT